MALCRLPISTPLIIPAPTATWSPTPCKGLGITYCAGEDDETESLGQRQKEVEDAYYRGPRRAEERAMLKRWEIEARQKSGTQDQEIEFDKNTAGDPRKVEVVHIMINCGDLTQRVIVNTGRVTRVGGEYETTTQGTKVIDAFTEQSKHRAMLKSWDTGPPPADIDASNKSWDTGPPPADIDAAQDAGNNTYTHTSGDRRPTYFTHTHVTYTYIQGVRNAAGEHVRLLTPAPNHTQIILPSPINIPGLQSVQSLQYRSPST